MKRFLIFALAVCILPGLALAQSTDPSQGPDGDKADLKKSGSKEVVTPEWKTCKMGYRATKADKFPFVTPNLTSKSITGKIALPSQYGFGTTKERQKLGVDMNGDGTPDVWAKSRASELDLVLKYADGKRQPYRIQANRTGSAWAYYRACYRYGSFNGSRIVLIDNNNNGRYNDIGTDSMVVGTSKYACYLSPTVSIKGKIYECKAAENGASVQFKEMATETGRINVHKGFRAVGGLAAAVLVSGSNSFEVTKNATLPVGTYTLKWGVVAKGNKSAQIRNGPTVTIEAGKTATVKFGAPFKMSFNASRAGKKVTVSSRGIKVYGSTGEEYYGFSKASLPKIIVRNPNTGKIVSSGKMGTA